MKDFLKRLLYLFPIPIFIIAINYLEDPANLFNDKYERGISDYLIKGYNVTNVVNYNERLLQKYFIEEMHTGPYEIALGSSRIMQVNSSFFPNICFVNNGVSGASLEDDIAIYHLYEKKGIKVKKILLAVDPWLLNDNNEQVNWKILEKEYFTLSNKLLKNTSVNIPNHKYYRTKYFEKYSKLLSLSYFKYSIKYLFEGIDKKYYPTTKMENNGFTRLKDGSIYYDAKYRNVSMEKVEERACNDKIDPVYSLGKFTHLSEHYKIIFSKFIEYLQKQNIQVEFYLSPFHPILYDYFKKNNYYHIVFQTEKYFRDFAANKNIKVYGSYDPSKYALDNSYFYDGLHCNMKAIEKILKSDIN